MVVEWMPEAKEALLEARDWYRQGSDAKAQKFLDLVFKKEKQIADFPRSGRVIPSRKDELFREVFIDKYRMMYRIKPNLIEIVTFIHGARDFK